MTAFRAYLAVVLAFLTGYTVIVGNSHGWNLIPIFFSDIGKMAWPGQFNVDFMAFLSLAGIWVAWRHHFSGNGIALGIAAFFGGMIFLAPYLLWASAQAEGDIRVMLLGRDRVGR